MNPAEAACGVGRLTHVEPLVCARGLRLLWHYLSHKTISRRAFAVALLSSVTLVYIAAVWSAWQASPFA